MNNLEYTAAFEEALEAVNGGHQVTHENFDDFCKSTMDIIHQCNEWLYPKEALTGWAIIKKPTDKELLIEHFKKERRAVCVVTAQGAKQIVIGAGIDSYLTDSGTWLIWDSFNRLATKEEALSLVLDKGNE